MAGSLLARSTGLLAALSVATTASAQVTIGAPAPAIDLEALENTPVDIGMTAEDVTWDALAGKTVVLEFWATWCGPCIAAIPHLNELADSYAGTDDVVFLSVTDEPVDHVNEFRTRREMRSWIGHDLDRDTIGAFGVRGIPRTFLIHDGRVMADTHPSQLKREHIEIARRGEVVEYLSEHNLERGSDVGGDEAGGSMPLGRRDRVDMTAGLDPYSTLDVTPEFQIIVREPDPAQRGMYSGDASVTMLGQTIDTHVALFWGVPRYAVDLDESLEGTRFDVIVRRGNVPAEAIRPIVSAAMGVNVEQTTVSAQGYRAVLGEEGLKLEASGLEQALGHSTRSSPEMVQVISESNTVGQLLALTSSLLGVPIEDATETGDDLYRYSVFLNADREGMPAEFFESTGIRLEPIETEVEGVAVRPIER